MQLPVLATGMQSLSDDNDESEDCSLDARSLVTWRQPAAIKRPENPEEGNSLFWQMTSKSRRGDLSVLVDAETSAVDRCIGQ